MLRRTKKTYLKDSERQTKKVGHRQATPIARETSSGQKIVKKERPSQLSRGEIRDRVEAHKKEKEDAYKVTLNSKNSNKAIQKPGEQVKEKIAEATKAKVEITPEGEPFGDIKKNDPNDSDTKEKIKGALNVGSFNFSDKERDVLSKILSS